MLKKALVTGANGFVGSWLCRELTANHAEVYAVVKDENENIDNIIDLPGLHIVYCELSQIMDLPQKIPVRDIDVFYHMAWVGVSGPLGSDYNVQLENVRYSCDAVSACHEMCCPRFIFSSSIMEYECAKALQTINPVHIKHMYSVAKIAANYMAKLLAFSLNIEYISAIISNTYGPGENSPRLINTTLRKMLKGEKTSFTAATQMYDFIYIEDTVKAFYKIGLLGHANKSYYIGTISPKPLKDFLMEIHSCMDAQHALGLGEITFKGVSLSYDEFNIYELRDDTQFTPETDFKQGIIQTAEWIKGNDLI